MKIIAHIETDFPTKFGVPRQSGVVASAMGRIVFEKEFQNPAALKGLEEFSHIWVLWEFSQSKKEEWSPTVRPPLLGGNTRMGVFATRSPYRPNPIGLSVLKLEGIEKTQSDGYALLVSGCDMIDKTPIFDIKPYLTYCDSIVGTAGGFTENLDKRELEVDIPEDLLNIIPKTKHMLLVDVLKNDPRPSYQKDPERIYGFKIDNYEIKFQVNENKIKVISIQTGL